MQRSLIADKSSGILTKRFREKEYIKTETNNKDELKSLKHYRNVQRDDILII